MGAVEFSLKAIGDAQKSEKENALAVLLELSMKMTVQLRWF